MASLAPGSLPLTLARPFGRSSHRDGHQRLMGKAGLSWLVLAVALMINAAPSALACGGGGSGAYRKPPRPGQHPLHSQLNSQLNPQAVSAQGESKNSEPN